MLIGQRTQKNAFDHSKHGSGSANAEGESADGEDRESWRFLQLAKGVAEILSERGHRWLPEKLDCAVLSSLNQKEGTGRAFKPRISRKHAKQDIAMICQNCQKRRN